MVGFNKKDEDMSMEDILSSIRKYVSEEDISKSNKFTSSPNENKDIINNDKVINLDASSVFSQDNDDNINNVKTSTMESDTLQRYDVDNLIGNNNNNIIKNNTVDNNKELNGTENGSPFNKLAEALKTYGKQKKVKMSDLSYNMTVEQFLRTIVESYVQKWMDENLKKIVEQIVLKEVEKLKSE